MTCLNVFIVLNRIALNKLMFNEYITSGASFFKSDCFVFYANEKNNKTTTNYYACY